MPQGNLPDPAGTILLIGASRGLGHAMAAEFLRKGWTVVGTVRGGGSRTKLHDLAEQYQGRVEIEILDIREPDQIAALHDRLSGRVFDMLFVNAGVTNNPAETIAEVTTDEFVRVMVTNSLSPMRVLERLEHTVPATGLIGVMSSGQGSIANNETGQREVYRGSKAALNMFMRSFAARHAGTSRAMVIMAPGWVRTEMGGPDARLSIEESIPILEQGRVAYVGEGGNRLPAVHVSDAVRLYRLALETGRAGARYHAVGEEGVALRDIAGVIGAGLKMPVVSIAAEEAPEYFGWLAGLAQIDLAASGALTRQQLNWNPTGPDLLTDLRNMDYSVA
jgi:NAD(P)-dependent dehydrogenase (short-subunit alcohol dehydrogenase family)